MNDLHRCYHALQSSDNVLSLLVCRNVKCLGTPEVVTRLTSFLTEWKPFPTRHDLKVLCRLIMTLSRVLELYCLFGITRLRHPQHGNHMNIKVAKSACNIEELLT